MRKKTTSDYIDQLSEEFGVSKKHIEVIIAQPFKFITNMIRAKENKAIRLQNFGILHPKKTAKFDDGFQEDIQSIPSDDQPNGRSEGHSGEED